MIITRTPFRMSFFGGGTDIENYFNTHNGAVLSTTFDKYCHVVVRHLPRFFDYSSELVYSKMERINDIEQIEHPLIREAMKMLDMREIRLSYEADLPARSGLGTSSSFAVGMLNAFHRLKNDIVDKKRLADEAIYLERQLCKEQGGWQDQIAAFWANGMKIKWMGKGIDEKGFDEKTGKMLVTVNPQWFRSTDVVNLLGNPNKAKTVLGWNPQKTSYEELVNIMAKADRKYVKNLK